MIPKLLNNYLYGQNIDKSLSDLLFAIARASKYVAHAIRTGDLGLAGTSNMYGENQLTLDVLSDRIFTEHLKATGLVYKIASEEQENEEILSSEGKYCVAFDPLDGSSLVDANLAVGAIFGIFEGRNFIGRKCREMIASCYVIFGPRIVFIMGYGDRVLEFTMNELGEFALTKDNIKIAPQASTFSPGNLRACLESANYASLLNHWKNRALTLRYSGGMVPDIHQIFAKGNGIFSYPPFSKYPEGKLRLLFECAPFAFLAEIAGASAKNHQGVDILDLEIKDIHQRTSIFIGSSDEVQKSLEIIGG